MSLRSGFLVALALLVGATIVRAQDAIVLGRPALGSDRAKLPSQVLQVLDAAGAQRTALLDALHQETGARLAAGTVALRLDATVGSALLTDVSATGAVV